jgi:signal peptidase I
LIPSDSETTSEAGIGADAAEPASATLAQLEHAGEAADANVTDPNVERRAGGRHRAPGRRSTKAESGPWGVRLAKDVAFVVVTAIILSFLLKTFLIQSFYIPSESMEPTLELDDRVVVTKLAPGLLDVNRGDIVVFRDPGHWVSQRSLEPEAGAVTGFFRSVAQAIGLAPSDSTDYLIKRVIGVAGDHVACRGQGAPVTVNGVALDELYIYPGDVPSIDAFDVIVPPNAVWVMGDHRSRSADSRSHQDGALNGAVSLDLVVGVAQVRSWPFNRIDLLRNPGTVFEDVPNESGG